MIVKWARRSSSAISAYLGTLIVPSCAPLGADRRCPEPGVRAGRRPPGGLGLDRGEDIATLEPCGRAEVGVGDRGGRAGSACRCATRVSRLTCAGWLPQDRVFGWSATAGLRTSVAIDP